MSFSQKPRTLNTTRDDLVQNHVGSFDFLFKTKGSPGCLDMILKYLPTYEIDSPYILDQPAWRYWIKSIHVGKPFKGDASALDKRLFPAECRQRMVTYSAPFIGTLCWEYIGENGTKSEEFEINFGEMPIMLRSSKCHLNGMSEEQLVKVHEDGNELGGYFIANGNERVIRMIITERRNQCRTQRECLAFIGEKFRKFYGFLSKHAEAEIVGQAVLDNCIFIHCKDNDQKFNLLALGIRKLYAFVEGKICAEKIDVASNCHEVVTAGGIIAGVVRMGLLQYLSSIKENCQRYFRKHSKDTQSIQYEAPHIFEPLINPQKIQNGQIGDRLGYFLNTGNLPYADRTWKQKAGWSITADRINYFRFLSHFRAVHRGAFWAEMRTTDVRKLRPECWGFLCPVHTPDGTPCGLLNHLAAPANVITHYYFNKNSYDDFIHALLSIGLLSLDSLTGQIKNAVPVLLNGIFIGYLSRDIASDFVDNLRKFKIKSKHGIPQTLSIGAVFTMDEKRWPEITLSTLPGRMVRPVQHLEYNKIEWITPMEQVNMNIAVIEDEIRSFTTHLEMNAQTTLSVLAGCTPFSDNNQSPRNMYQCQMLKQAMGLFAMNMDYRSDNKAYRLQNPQTPITQNDAYKKYKLNDYACGTNAVVAVISYTGYDMEDAMIICKQSMQRGFKHGYVYVTKVIDLSVHQTQLGELHLHLRNIANDNRTLYDDKFDNYGLPMVGTIIEQKDPFYILYNDVNKEFKAMKYKKAETCVVEQVRVIKTRDNEYGHQEPVVVTLKLRYDRSPIIGDKFASRAGQKGTLAQLWPQENMPFTENGIVPDLIINPHAFPSRMTIGMLLESMASKSGALNGEFYDSTPFKFDEKNRAVDHFGKKLLANGYSYYGAESMYCGTTGVAMKANIYIGLVYYQRLRHMISDKYQVRAMGPVNNLTKQPLKGRKRKGGIRLGEMERDALIAHGCAFLLHDRLFHCSDGEVRWLCKKCGSFMTVYDNPSLMKKWCKVCDNGDDLTRINVPHVFSYLSNELAAMNVKLTLKVEEKPHRARKERIALN